MKESLKEKERTCAADVPEQRVPPQDSAAADTEVPSPESAGIDTEAAPQEAAGADAPTEAAGQEVPPTDVPQSGEIVGTDGRGLSSEECALPMAWHRFLTHFGLWLEAAIHAFQGAWLLWGGQYYTAELRNRVRAEFPLLWAMDALLATVAIVAAVLCVRTAIVLRRRRADGARLLRWTYLLLLGGQLMFGAGRWLLIGLTPLSMSVLCPAALYLALLLVNGSYYKRRKRDASDACVIINGAFEP